MRANERTITTKVIQDNKNKSYAIIKRKIAEFFASKYKDEVYGNHSSGRE